MAISKLKSNSYALRVNEVNAIYDHYAKQGIKTGIYGGVTFIRVLALLKERIITI